MTKFTNADLSLFDELSKMPSFGWERGMVSTAGHIVCRVEDGRLTTCDLWGDTHVWEISALKIGFPDFHNPATQGAMMGRLQEIEGDPHMSLSCDPVTKEWYVSWLGGPTPSRETFFNRPVDALHFAMKYIDDGKTFGKSFKRVLLRIKTVGYDAYSVVIPSWEANPRLAVPLSKDQIPEDLRPLEEGDHLAAYVNIGARSSQHLRFCHFEGGPV